MAVCTKREINTKVKDIDTWNPTETTTPKSNLPRRPQYHQASFSNSMSANKLSKTSDETFGTNRRVLQAEAFQIFLHRRLLQGLTILLSKRPATSSKFCAQFYKEGFQKMKKFFSSKKHSFFMIFSKFSHVQSF